MATGERTPSRQFDGHLVAARHLEAFAVALGAVGYDDVTNFDSLGGPQFENAYAVWLPVAGDPLFRIKRYMGGRWWVIFVAPSAEWTEYELASQHAGNDARLVRCSVCHKDGASRNGRDSPAHWSFLGGADFVCSEPCRQRVLRARDTVEREAIDRKNHNNALQTEFAALQARASDWEAEGEAAWQQQKKRKAAREAAQVRTNRLVLRARERERALVKQRDPWVLQEVQWAWGAVGCVPMRALNDDETYIDDDKLDEYEQRAVFPDVAPDGWPTETHA